MLYDVARFENNNFRKNLIDGLMASVGAIRDSRPCGEEWN